MRAAFVSTLVMLCPVTFGTFNVSYAYLPLRSDHGFAKVTVVPSAEHQQYVILDAPHFPFFQAFISPTTGLAGMNSMLVS